MFPEERDTSHSGVCVLHFFQRVLRVSILIGEKAGQREKRKDKKKKGDSRKNETSGLIVLRLSLVLPEATGFPGKGGDRGTADYVLAWHW